MACPLLHRAAMIIQQKHLAQPTQAS